jgi:hypothetical protein
MQNHVTTFLQSFDDGVTATVRLLHWAVSFYVSNVLLIGALSIVPVLSRWVFVLWGEQLLESLLLIVESVVGLFRVALVIVVITIVLSTTTVGSGLSINAGDRWPLIAWQVLLLGGVFLVANACLFVLTSDPVVDWSTERLGVFDGSSRIGSLVSFTIKNLVTIPLFVICLCGLIAELLGG